MAAEKVKHLIESIDLKNCAFCGEALLMKGTLMGPKILPEINLVTREAQTKNSDVVLPIVCPNCGFIHLFTGETLGVS